MEAIDDVLEDSNMPQEVPSVVKTLAIFTYIGNGLLILLFLFVMAMIETFIGEFVNKVEGADIGTDTFITYFMVACGFIILLCIGSIIGAFQMTKGRKLGFYIYAALNAVWIVLLIYGGEPQGLAMAAISIGFLIGFGTQLKNFPG